MSQLSYEANDNIVMRISDQFDYFGCHTSVRLYNMVSMRHFFVLGFIFYAYGLGKDTDVLMGILT